MFRDYWWQIFLNATWLWLTLTWKQVTKCFTSYLSEYLFQYLADFGYRWKVLARGFAFLLQVTVSHRIYLLQLRFTDCRFFVLEAQVARFDEGVLPSALSVFHDDSSFRSGQFIKWYIYILFFCYWGNIVIIVFIICLMAGRNRLVSRMALPTIEG